MSTLQPFQQFQMDFGRYLRDPRVHHRPDGIPARRAGLYRELLRSNLEGFLLACFPVCRAVLGTSRWGRLVDAFSRDARCQTPYFREIPREFVSWLDATESLPGRRPPWLCELARYEWAELAVDVMDTAPLPSNPVGDLLAGIPVLAPALMNLAFDWPVQRISPAWRPRRPRQTHLLVYRDARDEVCFMELNPVSARLVDLLLEGDRAGRDACLVIANEIAHPQADAVVSHGAHVLADLRGACVILGSRP